MTELNQPIRGEAIIGRLIALLAGVAPDQVGEAVHTMRLSDLPDDPAEARDAVCARLRTAGLIGQEGNAS